MVILSLLLNYYATHHSEEKIGQVSQKHKGWLLAIFAGIGSGFQNISFVIVSFHESSLFTGSNSFWYWPPFLFIAGIIMLAMYWLNHTKTKIEYTENDNTPQTALMVKQPSVVTCLLLLAALFYTGSLAIYSMSMSWFNPVQRIYGWPAFLLSIILASQLWGIVYKEHVHLSRKQRNGVYLGVGLLIVAVLILSSLSN